MARTTKDQWLEAGFDLVREGGEDELTIERLCAALERTKGAFYHHFADIDSFHRALLEAWAHRNTQGPIDAAESASVEQRRLALQRAVSGLDQRLELAFRAWADRAPAAKAACQAVDARRVAYLQGLWEQQGKPRAHAGQLAELEYAAFLGLLARHGPDFKKHRATYALLVKALAAVGTR